jgi:F1F0 ATPase subunit 2
MEMDAQTMITALASLPPLAGAAIGLAVGLALGLAHFASLRRVTALYLDGGSPARAVALQLLRLALLAGLMLLLARLGAAPLIAGALGTILAREVILRRARKEA